MFSQASESEQPQAPGRTQAMRRLAAQAAARLAQKVPKRIKLDPLSPQIWKRFWAIASPYFLGSQRFKAWAWLAALLLILLAQTQFAVLLNRQTGEFTSPLAEGNADRFWASIRYCAWVLAVAIPVYAWRSQI